MPRKVFTAGEVLAAADVNSFLMDQTVMTFAGTAARGSAIGTATEGMVTYLNDSNSLSVYNGTDWTTDRTIQVFAGTAARGSAIPTPVEGMVTYLENVKSYDAYNGTAWVSALPIGSWTAYTPSLSNITLGNGTISAKYARLGKVVHVTFFLTLGSTSAIGTGPGFSLPFTGAQTLRSSVICDLQDASFGAFQGTMFITTTSAFFTAVDASATYTTVAGITSTVPFTWTTSDTLSCSFTYEAA